MMSCLVCISRGGGVGEVRERGSQGMVPSSTIPTTAKRASNRKQSSTCRKRSAPGLATTSAARRSKARNVGPRDMDPHPVREVAQELHRSLVLSPRLLVALQLIPVRLERSVVELLALEKLLGLALDIGPGHALRMMQRILFSSSDAEDRGDGYPDFYHPESKTCCQFLL